MDRKVEKYVEGEWWVEIPMNQLQKGDVFRIWNFIDYKNIWEQYIDDSGRAEWKVISDPYTHPVYHIWTIDVGEPRGWAIKKEPCAIVLWDMEHLIYGAGKKVRNE